MFRSALTGCLLAAMAALVAAPAAAQDLATLTITLTDDPGPIGIDTCSSRTADTLSLSATVTPGEDADERTPIYRFYFYTGAQSCTRQSGLVECPSFGYDSDGMPCGCIDETTLLDSDNGFSTSTSLRTAFAGAVEENLCVDGAPDVVNIFAEAYYEASGGLTAESVVSGEVPITVDRNRPSAPGAAPRLIAVEGALIVSADAVSEANAYEVCVRAISNDEAAAATTLDFTVFQVDGSEVSNTTLQENFTRCRNTGSEVAGYRFDGLENNVNHEVVYAVYDTAGNRGPNSRSAFGTPLPQRDFAEQYTAQLGGYPGETGGCAAAPAGGPTGLGWLTLGLLALIRRRRP